MRDIIVLAGSTPWSVLSLCKCAKRHKAKAFVVCVKNLWGEKYARSRYVDKAYDTEEEEMDSFWQRFLAEHTFPQKPILYVTSDYVCQVVRRNREWYEEHFELCMASSHIVDSFIDKNAAAVEAVKHGLVVPKTMEVHAEDDIDNICRNLAFPVIVKPVTFRDHLNAGFKTQVCETERDLRQFLQQHLEKEINLQCQEYIKGNDRDCVFYQFYRDDKGNITECMGEKTMQTNGIMTIGTTKFDEQLKVICHAFLESIDYVGIGGIEFKRNADKYYFIEMSTRTEGFLHISDMAGVSLAEASYADRNGEDFIVRRQEEGVRYMVFMSLFRRLRRKYGLIGACIKTLRMHFRRKSYFVGENVDLCFAMKLDFGTI